MAYVLTNGGATVVTYPYSVGLLRRDNPNVSFPASPTNAQLAEWNVYPVVETPAPDYDVLTSSVAESMASPAFTNGEWVRVWEVTTLSSSAAEAVFNQYAESARQQAAELLREGDTHVVQSIENSQTLHPDFVAYRNALRSVAALPGYPVAPQFPAPPTNIFADEVELSTDFENTLT